MPKIKSCYVTMSEKPTQEEEDRIDTMLSSLGYVPTANEWEADVELGDDTMYQQEYVRRTT